MSENLPEKPKNKGFIYHLIREMDWERAMEKGVITNPSLKTEGFIHCSTATQYMESATKHFTDVDTVLLLKIITKRVKNHLQWEISRNNEYFPHLYGPIQLEDVDDVEILSRNAKGEWEKA